MATRFQSIEMKAPGLFGVELAGTVSPADRRLLNDLAEKCLARRKTHVVLDFSQVKTMGGGGASALAKFQQQLVDVGGEAVFVGAGDTVRHFLEQKFEDLPLRHFGSVDEAQAALSGVRPEAESEAGPPASESDPEPDPDPESDPELEELELGELPDVGALGFFEEDEDAEPADEPAADPAGEQAPTGRRKDHRYTSLAEAVKALGSVSESEGEKEFSDALGNLLFSQGLAESVTLMVAQDNLLASHDRRSRLRADGPLAKQFLGIDRPLTLLDVQDEELSEDEITLLADLNPDMILPVVQDGQLTAVIMLQREGENREYTVAENFAFELLIAVLAGAGDNSEETEALQLHAAAASCQQKLAAEEDGNALAMPEDQMVTEALLKLVIDLPKADDEHHFWRIFARHAWNVFHLGELAYMAPDRTRPSAILNQKSFRMNLDLSNDRLQRFFRSVERPVEVRHFPNFFKETKEQLEEAGVTWVIGLNWDKNYLGTVLMDGASDPGDGSVLKQLTDLFAHTARMFAQFSEREDSADDLLAVVRILTAQRERRLSGSDTVTAAMLEQIDLLTREMGFPPDQKRSLMYGCLLRDIGLIDQPDDLVRNPHKLSTSQAAEYRKHPERGAQLLAGLKLPSQIVDVVRYHHERFNGEGYPVGLTGRKIPLLARVVAVVEGYVELITGVKGRAPLTPKEAGRQILKNQDGRYDPDLAVVFLSAVSKQLQQQSAPVEPPVGVL